jgi:hypothetical protein
MACFLINYKEMRGTLNAKTKLAGSNKRQTLTDLISRLPVAGLHSHT